MTDDSLSRMTQAMGFREEQPCDTSEEEAARSAPRCDQESPAAPAAESGNNTSMDDELERVLAQSRVSAESEAQARRQREDEAFERALAASSSVEGQQLSEAERYAQEERDLLKALELSQIGSAGPPGEGSSSGTSHLTDLQLNGAASTPRSMPVAVAGPSHLTAEHTGSTAIASMRQVQSGSPVLPTSPSPPVPPLVHRTSSHRSGPKPLPLPPNGNVLQPETPRSSPPPSVTGSSIRSRLPNPFDDCMSIAEVPQESPGWGSPPSSIPYNHTHQAFPFDASHQPQQPVNRQKVPRVTSTSSFASGPSWSEGSHGGLPEWPQNPSSSTFDLESSQDSHSHGDHVDQLREEEKVSDDVLIGFPRLAPLSSGRVFPQVVQVSAESGLETFSIQAKSYRSLITYLCWCVHPFLMSPQVAELGRSAKERRLSHHL